MIKYLFIGTNLCKLLSTPCTLIFLLVCFTFVLLTFFPLIDGSESVAGFEVITFSALIGVENGYLLESLPFLDTVLHFGSERHLLRNFMP